MQYIQPPISGDNTTIEMVGNVIRIKAQGVDTPQIKAGAILNDQVGADAAIAKTKLAALGIVSADIDAAAAIPASKLAGDVATQAELDVVAAALATHDALSVIAAHGDPFSPVFDTGSINVQGVGQVIAEIDAGAGYKLVGIRGILNANGTSSGAVSCQVVVTYTDASTATLGPTNGVGNDDETCFTDGIGLMVTSGGSANGGQCLFVSDVNAAKAIQKISLQTGSSTVANHLFTGSLSALKQVV